MARSAKEDPVEKFRFRVSVIAISPTLAGAVETLPGVINTILGRNDSQKSLAAQTRVFMRLGFSNVTLPRTTISEIPYRENIDHNRFTKQPGLVRYEPVLLKRGVTKNRDMYDWLRLVNDEIALLATAQELGKDSKYPTVQSEAFRKDVIIEVLDREGNPIKGWYLFNAWPTSYKPGDDLDAEAEQKLVEELTLTYELFLELEGGLAGFTKELAKNAVEGFVNKLTDPKLKLPFSR